MEQEELTAWARHVVGTSVSLERAVVRREGWIARATDERRWFLRLGRDSDPANPPEGVIAEARLTERLHARGVAVPKVAGIDDRGAALYEWVDGTADVDNEPVERHDELLGLYIDQLAILHAIDPDDADVEWMARPTSAREAALAHAEAVYDQMGSMALEPLSTFGMAWLRWHAPDEVTRLSVLHGDAGVGNFLVTGDRLEGVIDWEWAHLGDPMEDLGSTAMHASFHPVGDLAAAFRRYEAMSGIPVDLAKVRYYAAHLYIRSVIALSAHVNHLDPHNPVALNLAYKVVNDRLTCEAIADALGVELDAPPLPVDDDHPVAIHDVVVANLENDVAPATTTDFARDRAAMSARLVAALGRQARHGAAIAAVECDELTTLLGDQVDDLETGLRELDRAIGQWGQAREVDVLRYLYRRAVRAEWLAGPVADLFPNRVIGAF